MALIGHFIGGLARAFARCQYFNNTSIANSGSAPREPSLANGKKRLGAQLLGSNDAVPRLGTTSRVCALASERVIAAKSAMRRPGSASAVTDNVVTIGYPLRYARALCHR